MSNMIDTIIQNNETLYNNTIEIAKTQQRAYHAGKTEGQKSEYDKFWDIYQNYGGQMDYQYAFAHNKFTDETYNPKYSIITKSGGFSAANNIFYNAINITDTKVPIIIHYTYMNNIFYGCKNLTTINKLILPSHNISEAKNAFSGCEKLTKIQIEGTSRFNCDISFAHSSLLSRESIDNIFDYLKDRTNWTKNNSAFRVEQDSETGKFPYNKVKFVLNENIENPQNYRVVYLEGSASGELSPELTSDFGANGEKVFSNFYKGLKDNGYTEFLRVERMEGESIYELSIGEDYNIYVGKLPDASCTVTFNANAIKAAEYTETEWFFKVLEANNNGWTVETV